LYYSIEVLVMDVAITPDTYSPSVNDRGDYVDYVPSIMHGIYCPCNSRKGNRSLVETKMKLMKVPKKPNRFMYFNQYINQKNQGWKEYLFQNKN